MAIGQLHILSAKDTPEIIMDPKGIIKISGRGMSIKKAEVSEEITEWINGYLKDPAEITYISLAFEYLNSNTTTKLVTVLRKLSEVVHSGKKYVVHWYYEEDDDDIIERGEYISSTFNIPMEFIKL